MSAPIAFLRSWAAVVVGMGELLRYGWRFLKSLFLARAVLAARVLAAESQLALCQERLESQGVRRHRFSDGFRWLWVLLASWWVDWQRHARLMQPATVKRWHEWGFRLFFWTADDLERKLESFKNYYNTARVHQGLSGDTPDEKAGAPTSQAADLENYRWQSHCRGLFELPGAA